MTYTFKLARRLAVSRHSAWLAAVVLFVACDDTTAPDASPGAQPASLRILPRVVTIETNQRIRFRGEGRTVRGEFVAAMVAWEANGGVIHRDGTFSSATIGTFKVTGRGRGWKKADTSVVIVVPPQPATRITLDPESATLDPGATQAFTATGHMSDGSTAAIGVTWTATGGTIDPDGFYRAGETSGSFRVIAASTDGTVADTAAINVTAPAAPEPPAEPTAPLPTSPPPSVGSGIPYGSFHLPKDWYGVRGASGLLRVLSTSNASTELAAAKAKNMRVVVSLTGAPPLYENADGTFNLTKWKSRMDLWRPHTSLLKQYYDNGTIILNYVVDEPNCATCWGGQIIPHSTLQEMTRYAKAILPFLPTVIRVHPGWLKSTPSWPYLDAAWAQTAGPLHVPSAGMTPDEFRAKVVAEAKSLNLALVLGMNTLNGGDGSSRINGTSSQDPNLNDEPSGKYRYQMSAEEFERTGKSFAAEPYACAVINWRHSPTMTGYPTYTQQFDLRSDVQAAAARIAAVAAGRATKSCRKPGS
jgi:hypothetical protein